MHSKFRIVVVVYLLKNVSLRYSCMLDAEYQFDCFLISTELFYKIMKLTQLKMIFLKLISTMELFFNQLLILGRNSNETSQAITRMERTT